MKTSGVLQLKLVFIGSVNIGKSCLCSRIRGLQGPLPLTRPTIFSETSAVHYDGDDYLEDEDFPRVVVNLFDSSGQEKISVSAVARQVYRSAHIVWLVYAVNNRSSFDHIADWHDKVVGDVQEDCVFVVVGNKCDLDDEEREVPKSEAAAFCAERGFPFFETSALDTTNVMSTFEYSVREVVKVMKRKGLLNSSVNSNNSTNGKKPDFRPKNPGHEENQKKEKGGCCK